MSAVRIFLIDDDLDDQEIFTEALQEVNPEMKCEAAGNGKLALERLMKMHQLPAAVFLDLNMPVMNGREFLSVVKQNEQLKEIPVVIYSTTNVKHTADEMMKLGASKVLSKPESFDKIVASIKSVLDELGL
ncbi:MAG: response regulator [Chitinophagaceae bacterium]|nr:MAG: response regulator [Chitinophagaceae bacterium]